MQGVLSKGITLSHKIVSGSTESWEQIHNLQTVPDLGGDVEQIDVTTLEDDAFHFKNGIKNFGSLDFTFLYDNSSATSNYRVCKSLENTVTTFKVTFPDTTTFEFDGEPHVKVAGADVNTALKFTLSIALQSDLDVTDPV